MESIATQCSSYMLPVFEWTLFNGTILYYQWGMLTHCKQQQTMLPHCLSSLTCICFFHLFIFIYLYFHLRTLSTGSVIFPGVSVLMSIGKQNDHASPLSWVTQPHLFCSFIYFHQFLFSYTVAFQWFCDFCWCIGFDVYWHTKLLCFPIVLGRSPAFIFSFFSIYWFIFIYISVTDAFQWFREFCRCIGFDVHQHTKFQLSLSPARYRTLISVSQWVSVSGENEL